MLASVRSRLTFWHAGVLALIVCLFAAGSLLFVRARLYAELDAQLAHELAVIERVYQDEPGELADLPVDRGFMFFHIAEDARLRHQSDGWRQLGFPLAAASAAPASWAATDGTWFRLQALASPSYRIAAAVDESAVRHIVRTFGLILLFGIPFALGLAIAGGYFLAGRVLAPVGAMADKARQIGAESLVERLPVKDPRDEFGRLATVFNDTLARLQGAFERLRRFTADASHELRTPLTAMRSVGEVALQARRDPEHYRDVIGSMLEEVDRLTSLVDNLLTLTRADSGSLRLDIELVELGEFAKGVGEQLRILAEEKQQRFGVEAGTAVCVRGDPKILRLALANVIHNAIKYTPPGGSVQVRVHVGAGGRAEVEVRDSGPGIAAGQHELVFERFYRAAAGRAADAAGAGLGLAIARWAVEAHGGRLELESAPAKGSLFRISLPGESVDLRA
jgi:heavy metal sensor kinase